jgi:hypothetical protein
MRINYHSGFSCPLVSWVVNFYTDGKITLNINIYRNKENEYSSTINNSEIQHKIKDIISDKNDEKPSFITDDAPSLDIYDLHSQRHYNSNEFSSKKFKSIYKLIEPHVKLIYK